MTELAAQVNATVSAEVNFADALQNSKSFKEAYKMADFLSKSSLIPEKFQGKASDILLALGLAARLKVSLIEVLNGINIIKGQPTFSAQFAITLANTRGPFVGSISYIVEGEGPSLKVTAKATLKTGGEESATVSMEMARAEGWTKNPKYQTMPEHMLKLRAATFLIREVCPEVLAGYMTVGEAVDIRSNQAAHLNRRLKELENV